MRIVDYSKQAIRTLTELRKSGGKTSEQMRKELLKLEKNPMPSDVKKLKGHELFRVRVGDFRIIYHFNDTTIFVTIIDRRDVVYKNL